MNKHILRYGTAADAKHISKFIDNFDMIAINGNMISHAPKAIADFIAANCLEKTCFFIDPYTHAFQHDINFIQSKKSDGTISIKKSIVKLAEAYGDIFERVCTSEDPLHPSIFTDSLIDVTAKNCVEFQQGVIKAKLQETGALEYIEYDEKTHMVEPAFYVAPYFYIDGFLWDKWLKVNLDYAKTVKRLYPDKQTYAQIVISKEILLSKETITYIKNAYSELGVDGYLIWVDDLIEDNANAHVLQAYARLLSELSTSQKDVINLYGGYLSILLSGRKLNGNSGIDGVVHGLEYGESRSVKPVGGGIPSSKFYYPQLHKRIDYSLATKLLQNQGFFDSTPVEGAKRYYEEICDCPKCKEIIGDNINNFSNFEMDEFYTIEVKGRKQRRRKPSKETKEACLYHYLHSKNKEHQMIYDHSFDTIIRILESDHKRYSQVPGVESDVAEHLEIWSDIIQGK